MATALMGEVSEEYLQVPQTEEKPAFKMQRIPAGVTCYFYGGLI